MKNVKGSILSIIILSNVILFAVIIFALDVIYPARFVKEAENALKNETAFREDYNATDYLDSYLTDNIFYAFPDETDEEDYSYSKRIDKAESDIKDYYHKNNLSDNVFYKFKTDNGYYVLIVTDETEDVLGDGNENSSVDNIGNESVNDGSEDSSEEESLDGSEDSSEDSSADESLDESADDGSEDSSEDSSVDSSEEESLDGSEEESLDGSEEESLDGSEDGSEDSSEDSLQPDQYRMITYINIGPYMSFLYTLNWFILVFFLLEMVVMCVIGWKLGRKIEKSQESQRLFFQNSSHELKTPLMSIQGYAEGIQTGVLDGEHASKVIISETEHMSKLVEELLSISKIDADQMVLKKIPLDIRETLYDCMMDLESLADMKQIKFLPEFTEEEALVACDEEQLERAFRNVLANAIQHGQKEIRITSAIENQKVKIQIIDDGPGISDEEKPHVFERFYTGTRKDGGTGIGLSLASEIIRLHGGSIQVVDATNTGAAFEILLPICRS